MTDEILSQWKICVFLYVHICVGREIALEVPLSFAEREREEGREHDLILAKLFLGIYFGWNALPKKN